MTFLRYVTGFYSKTKMSTKCLASILTGRQVERRHMLTGSLSVPIKVMAAATVFFF
jgi:hypothetical protein